MTCLLYRLAACVFLCICAVDASTVQAAAWTTSTVSVVTESEGTSECFITLDSPPDSLPSCTAEVHADCSGNYGSARQGSAKLILASRLRDENKAASFLVDETQLTDGKCYATRISADFSEYASGSQHIDSAGEKILDSVVNRIYVTGDSAFDGCAIRINPGPGDIDLSCDAGWLSLKCSESSNGVSLLNSAVDAAFESNLLRVKPSDAATISGYCASDFAEQSMQRSTVRQIGSDIDGEGSYWGGDLAGTSLALSKNGRVLAIGAPFNDMRDEDLRGTTCRPGHVRVYRRQSDNWEQLGDDIDSPLLQFMRDGDYTGSSDGTLAADLSAFDLTVLPAKGSPVGVAGCPFRPGLSLPLATRASRARSTSSSPTSVMGR